MVRVRYIGTGEAFDHRFSNTSIVYEGPIRLLLDCGYGVPYALWQVSTEPNWLDGIYLSHFHADHCFGLPALLARMGQDGRVRPLYLLGGVGSRQAIEAVLLLGYPRLLEKLTFALQWYEITPGEPVELNGVTLSTAVSRHSIVNHAVRLDDGTTSVCYSGDGAPTDETERLYRGASLLIHEAYYIHAPDKVAPSHANVHEVAEMGGRASVEQVHFVHFSRDVRPPAGITAPQPGDLYEI